MKDFEITTLDLDHLPTLVLPDSIGEMIKQLQSAMQPVIDMIQKSMSVIQEVANRFIDAVVRPLAYIFDRNPIFYIPTPRPMAEDPHKDEVGYLPVEVDLYGYFVIAGKKTVHYHSSTSIAGRILNLLASQRAIVVTYEQIQQAAKASDRRQGFKDLKRQLRDDGYKLDYALVRGEGIAMLGILAI